MEIDHVFVFIEPYGPELEYLSSLGLVETYRRSHPGQGTQNSCFCFENMFLECLWVINPAELRSNLISRTGLYERSQWRVTGACPFGIAWRTTDDSERFAPRTWAFHPPYLPVGMAIDVSVDGDDPHQPMMFRSPGGTPPEQWAPERRRELQKSAGLGRILALRLELPRDTVPSPTLQALRQSTFLDVRSVSSEISSLTCEVEKLGEDEPFVIRLPIYS